MRKDYKPDYAPGEILVCPAEVPNIDIGDEFFRNAGITEGYLLQGEHKMLEGVYIFKVPVGEEEKAIKYFKKLPIILNPPQKISVVGWAERRDLAWERRSDSVDELSTLVERLSDDIDEGLNREQYNKYLDRIKSYVERIKEKN